MKCPNCEQENRAGARFCATCGGRLPETAPAPAAPAETPAETPAEDRAGHPEAVEPEAVDAPPAPPDDTPALSEPETVDPVVDAATDEATTEEPVEPDEAEAEATGAGIVPLPASTILAGRYEIAKLMSSDAKGNTYLAHDLARCPICGFDANTSDDEYCQNCGAVMDPPSTCEIREQPAPAEPEAVARFTADGRAYAVLAPASTAQPDAGESVEPPKIRLDWAAGTDPGQVRDLNEDTVDVHVYDAQAGPTLGLFVVADGVGGQAAGEVASQLATHVIWEKIREAVWAPEMQGEPVLPETLETRVVEAVQAANQTVYQQRTEQATDMGTTVTLALVRDTVAVIANVGDSRAYSWSADGLAQLTVDHSLVQSLIDAGELERDAVYVHPRRNVIYRSVGDRPKTEVDVFVEELAPGERLILCSDGLWEMVRDEDIEEILLREPDPRAACDALVARANLAGGSDNISVIVVTVNSEQ